MDLLNRILTPAGDAVFSLLEPFSPHVALWIISAALGFLMLLAWRYTSNQKGIAEARAKISAHLLATRLFKDNLAVTFRAQRQILWQASRLLVYSLKPMLIMLVPFVLVIAQIGYRYEHRPLAVGETVLVKAVLNGKQHVTGAGSMLALPEGLSSDPLDPCRAVGERTCNWRITPQRAGDHVLVFGLNADRVEMPLSAGQGLQRLSRTRGGGWLDRLLYSSLPSIPANSAFESLWVAYPPRTTPLLGWDIHWLVSVFLLSIVFALLFKPFMKVHV